MLILMGPNPIEFDRSRVYNVMQLDVAGGLFMNWEAMMVRVDRLIRDPEYCQYIDENHCREVNRRYCRHDLQHMIDVARITYLLFLEAGDLNPFMEQCELVQLTTAREIIYAAGLLHDIGRWQEYDTHEDHAIIGARLAPALLHRAGFTDAEVEVICRAVKEHRRAGDGAGILGSHLSRADDLSRLCVRCLAREDCHKLSRMETGHHMLVY